MAWAGLILAGGLGERFGGPKAWAELPDGRTFLQACVEAFSRPKTLVATLPPGPPTVSLPTGLIPAPLDEEGLDMFASLRFGLEIAVSMPGWERVVINPVDHPLVRPQTIVALAQCSARASIATTTGGKHGHPVCIDRAAAEAIADGSDPGPTLRDCLARLEAIDLVVEDLGVIANCNTPERLAEAWPLVSKQTYR